jgi:Helix-turn-helix domain
MSHKVSSPVLPRDEAAEYIGLKPQTLAAWATTKRYDLPYILSGRRAMYRISDLEKFLESRTVNVGGEDQ